MTRQEPPQEPVIPPSQEPAAPPPEDGKVTVVVASDGMVVHATVTPPANGGVPVSEEQVLAELAAAKVTHGIDREAVRQLLKLASLQLGRRGGPTAIVARGRLPTQGEDGAIVPHELLQTPSGYPRLRDDGTADFFELNTVRNVGVGVALATRKPPTRGEPGFDVFGRELPAPLGRDVRLRPGKGTKLSPDGQAVLSEIEGHASISTYGEVTVTPIFTVAGDVDLSTGNIDFRGTVIVRGDIQTGLKVKAGKGVEVHGTIMGGSVEAGGDVIVRHGVVGAGKSRIVAGGKVECRFVEGAEIQAGGDVRVVEGILNARVSAGGSVRATGARGSIVGGLVCARTEVVARVIGSATGTPTEVQVGMAPDQRTELEELRRALHSAEERSQNAERMFAFLRQQESRPDYVENPAFARGRQQATRDLHYARAERERVQERMKQLLEGLEEAKASRIRASELIYPGVRIVIGTERYLVIDPSPNACFRLSEEGEITLAPNP